MKGVIEGIREGYQEQGLASFVEVSSEAKIADSFMQGAELITFIRNALDTLALENFEHGHRHDAGEHKELFDAEHAVRLLDSIEAALHERKLGVEQVSLKEVTKQSARVFLMQMRLAAFDEL